MIQARFQRAFQVSGLTFNTVLTVEAEFAPPWSVELPAAKTGQLTTRTDNDTGVLTMAGGHGITTGARLDVYWSGGSRRGMTVGTVSGNTVPIDGGAGDALPANMTSITAMVPSEEVLAVPGNNAQAVAVNCPVGGTVVFATSGNTEIFASVRTSANPTEVRVFSEGTNVFAGQTVAKVFLSHGSSAGASTLTGAVMYN